MKVYIEDWLEHLTIIIDEDEKRTEFEIYKDDGFSKLEEVFNALGIDCEYGDCY